VYLFLTGRVSFQSTRMYLVDWKGFLPIDKVHVPCCPEGNPSNQWGKPSQSKSQLWGWYWNPTLHQALPGGCMAGAQSLYVMGEMITQSVPPGRDHGWDKVYSHPEALIGIQRLGWLDCVLPPHLQEKVRTWVHGR
jgi:hypothetical protein